MKKADLLLLPCSIMRIDEDFGGGLVSFEKATEFLVNIYPLYKESQRKLLDSGWDPDLAKRMADATRLPLKGIE